MAGTLTISTLSDGTNSTSATNPIRGSAKAWVNFNGTGTVAIRASYNVSSITDNGTGDYTVNFTNAMPDANYVASTTSVTLAGTALNTMVPADSITARTTTALRLSCTYISGGSIGVQDPTVASVAVFR